MEINFPTDTPIAFVSVQPVPGWQYTTETTTLPEPIESEDGEITDVVSKVTFTGGAIKPGEFQQFGIELGPMPDEGDQVLFPTIQTYDSGEIVRWIDEPTEDGTEPEHPAPALTLTEAEEDHHGNSDDEEAADEASGSEDSGVTAENAAAAEDNDDSSSTLAVVGIVLGALGLIVAIYAVVTSRRRPTDTSGSETS